MSPLVLTFAGEKAEARLMDLQFAGHEIGFRGQDVAVFANAGDFARAFQLAQRFLHLGLIAISKAERRGPVPSGRAAGISVGAGEPEFVV